MSTSSTLKWPYYPGELTGELAIASRPGSKNCVGILGASGTRLTWVRLYARGCFLSPTSITFLEGLDHYRCIELTDYRLYADTMTEIAIAPDGKDWLATIVKRPPPTSGD